MTDDQLRELRELGKQLPFDRPDPARRDALRSSLLVEAAGAARPIARRRWLVIGGAFATGALAAAAVALVVTRDPSRTLDLPNPAQITASSEARLEHHVVATESGVDEIVHVHAGTVRIAADQPRRGDRVRLRTRDADVDVSGAAELEVVVVAESLSAVTVRAGTAEIKVTGQHTVLLSAGQTWRASVITTDLSPQPAGGPTGTLTTATGSPTPSPDTAVALARDADTIGRNAEPSGVRDSDTVADTARSGVRDAGTVAGRNAGKSGVRDADTVAGRSAGKAGDRDADTVADTAKSVRDADTVAGRNAGKSGVRDANTVADTAKSGVRDANTVAGRNAGKSGVQDARDAGKSAVRDGRDAGKPGVRDADTVAVRDAGKSGRDADRPAVRDAARGEVAVRGTDKQVGADKVRNHVEPAGAPVVRDPDKVGSKQSPRDGEQPAVRVDDTDGAGRAKPGNKRIASPIEQRFQAGWALLKSGKAREAAVELGAAADTAPSDPLAADARYFQAVALVRAGERAEAERVLVRFLDTAPRSLRRGRAAVLLGRLIGERGDRASARAWLESAVSDPDPAIASAARAGLQALDAATKPAR